MLGSWKNGLERGFGTRNEKVKRDRQRERERERERVVSAIAEFWRRRAIRNDGRRPREEFQSPKLRGMAAARS